MRFTRRTAAVAVLIAACVAAALATGVASHGTATATAAGPCQLGTTPGQVKHVIYLQFDNTHFRRDRANVPSDLEQMPHLLNFLKGNGTLLTNDHTILISHTAGGILASLTGLYPDRNGQTVSNSYDYFKADGTPAFTSSFKYWTDTVDGSDDSLPNMVGDGQQTTPAPWLTYTHAGCNVGGVSSANIVLENTSTAPAGDMTRVFGQGSPEWTEASTNSSLALTDFVGYSIHCAQGAALCNTPNAKPDDATIVPGSNDGYKALFGAKYVNPAITGGQACVQATDGSDITDPAHRCGFPGFDGALAKNTLGEVAQMQENGVPVTFAYISDAHDNHVLARASGPGEADYKQQLADYDTAFAAFFQRLQNHGIDKSNTLFVVTVDEGDHFAGGVGTPQSDGSLAYTHAPCAPQTTTCPSNQIGEITTNLKGLLPAGEPPFDLHFDDAPTIYVNGQPSRNNPAVRQLERDAGALTAIDPYQGGASVPLAQRLADPVEEAALHMVNSDPKRTPTFTLFGNADFFFQASNSGACGGTQTTCVDPKFAWNHGDFQDDIANTWVGLVGPGVANNGVDSTTWTDHVDYRPTINALLGLSDSYENDGRVINELLSSNGRRGPNKTVSQLGSIYKQIDAPFGAFGLDTLVASTAALKSTDELKYDSIETAIANLTLQRNTLADAIRQALNEDASGVNSLDEVNAKRWILRGQILLAKAHALAASS
jgi:hypothetical protein